MLIWWVKIEIEDLKMKKVKIGLVVFGGRLGLEELRGENMSGKVVDEKNEGLGYGKVVLLCVGDWRFIRGRMSKENGSFRVEGR